VTASGDATTSTTQRRQLGSGEIGHGSMTTADPLRSLHPVLTAREQATAQLREQIRSGSLPPGSRLPREADLAEKLGVSRATVRTIVRALIGEELLGHTRGRSGGVFVIGVRGT
jgi:DNA-binding GntR family transcriptional regulator